VIIKILSINFCLFISCSCFSQEHTNEPIKKIKVEKQSVFIKAAFDEADYKVIAFDRFGNPHTQAIKSFSIKYIDGKTTYEAPVVGNTFPDKTIQFLTKKRKYATKICLTNIVAEDKDGHSENLPELCDIVIFPDCKKINNKK
jgi:hypothetical protein